MRILLLEDDHLLCESIVRLLEDHEIQVCYTLAQAWMEMEKAWDLYLIDLNLPDGESWPFIHALRQQTTNQIVVISAASNPETIISGYKYGIDDYLIKPLTLPVLRAKLQRIQERHFSCSHKVKDGWTLKQNTLSGQAESIPLTRLEAAILSILLDGRQIPRERLIQTVFGTTGVTLSDNSLSVRLSALRKKLVPLGLKITSRRYEGLLLEEIE